MRLDGALETAGAFVERGLNVATHAHDWYDVGFGERTAARIARDRGHAEKTSVTFERALATFERIGARFESARIRREMVEIGHRQHKSAEPDTTYDETALPRGCPRASSRSTSRALLGQEHRVQSLFD